MTSLLSLQQEARIGSYHSRPLLPSVLLYRFPQGTPGRLLLEATAFVGEATDAWCHRFDPSGGRARPVAGAHAVAAADLGTVPDAGAVFAALDVPMDVTSEPLARALTARTSGGDVLFGLSVDHLVWDARSSALTAQHVADAYRGLAAGQRDVRPDTGPAYSAFVERQRREFDGEWGARLRRFWTPMTERFGPYPPAIEALPPPADGIWPDHDVAVDAWVPPVASVAIAARARKLRVSRYAYLLGAVLTALRSMLGSAGGVVVDAPSRPWPEFARTIGLFGCGLPIWDDPGEDGSVEATATRVHAYVGEAFGHAVPMRPLLRTMGTQPDLSRGVMPLVVFEDTASVPASGFAGAGGTLVVRPDGAGPSELSGHLLMVRFRELGDGLGVRLQTCSSQLDEGDAKMLLDVLVATL